jgi:aminoglycoside phosphotransferase (APT) family kinase protein
MAVARPPSQSAIPTLLEDTVRQIVSRTAVVVEIASNTITRGVSGAPVSRHELRVLELDGSQRTVGLVTKMTDQVERATLALLNAQQQPSVPRSYARDVDNDGPDWVCLEDLGDHGHPERLDEVPDGTLASEVSGLASIHAANAARDPADLGWLPRADKEYVRSMIEDVYWRPNWESAVEQNDFREEFADWLPRVEAAAGRVVEEMAALDEEADARTLVHTEVNPGNILIRDGRAFFIDWADAHLGSLYLDLPHHLSTLDIAERYRQELARLGVPISVSDFQDRYRVAARYAALRYMWWSVEAWREDRGMAGLVRHYLEMVDM